MMKITELGNKVLSDINPLPNGNKESPEGVKQPNCTRTGVKTLTLDIESSGLSWLRDKIYFIGYRLNAQGPVIQIPPNDYEQDETFRHLLADSNVVKRGHNVRFDLHFLRLAGYEINGPFDDTSLLVYLENPFESTSLKDSVERKLQRPVVRMDDFAVKPKKKELDKYVNNPLYFSIDKKFYEKQQMLEYNKADVINCDDLRKDVTASDWYKNVEQPVLHLIYGMEARGIQLDTAYLKELKSEYEQTLQEIEKGFEYKVHDCIFRCGDSECDKEVIKGVNLRSGRQVAEYLKKKDIILTEKTETGEVKTDKLVLKRLLWNGNEVVRPILKYRELSKLLNTYVSPLLDESDEQGRIHSSFNQAGRATTDSESSSGTRTGRLSSSNPVNLQNIPARTEEGNKIRKAFVSSSNHVMFDVDWKQIQPRFIAHYTQNKILLDAYEKNLDTHAIMGGIIFNKDPEKLTKLERFIGKTSWLADFFGCSYKKLKIIAETLSDEPIPFNLDYFKRVSESLQQGNPQLYSWRRQHIETTRQLGYVETFGGRVIKIPNLYAKDKFQRFEAERCAVNYLIQAGEADLQKLVLVELKKSFVDKNLGHILAVVHDEVLGEFPKDHTSIDLVNHIMTNTVHLKNVAILADAKIGNSWDVLK